MKRVTAYLLVLCMLMVCVVSTPTAFATIISNDTQLLTEDFSGTLSNWISSADSNPAIDKNIPQTLGGANTTDVLWVWGNASFGYNLTNPIKTGKVEFSFNVDPNKMANYEGETAERAFSVYVGGENLTASNVGSIMSISKKIGAMRIFKALNSTDAEFRRGWGTDFPGTETIAITGTGYRLFKIVVDMDTRRVNTYLDDNQWGAGYTLPASFTSVNSLMFTNYLNLAAVFVDNVSIKHTTTIDTDKLVSDVRWDFIVDEENFVEQPNTGASIDNVADGVLKLSTTDVDPYIRLNYLKNDYGISIKPGASHKYMKIRLKNNSSSTESTMMLVPEMQDGSTDYTGKPAPDWANSYNIKFYPTTNDTEFKEYVVPLPAPAEGKPEEYGSVFRFDYLNGVTSGSMEIDYIIFTRNETPPADNRLTEIVFESSNHNLPNVVVEDFSSNKEYYEIDIYRDIYNELSSENIALTFNDALEEPDASVTIKNLVTKKCVDIVASDIENGYLRNYRIVCRAVARPANDTEIVIEDYNIKDKTLTFSGYLTDGERQPISLLAYKQGDAPGASTLKIFKVFTPAEDGSFEGIVEIFDDETASQYYTMELCFDVAGEDEPLVLPDVYFNTAKIYASVEEMKLETDGILDFMATNENYPVYENIGVWLDKYTDNTELQSAMNESTKKYQATAVVDNILEIANGTIATFIANSASAAEVKKLLKNLDEQVKAVEVDEQRFKDLSDASQNWIENNFISNKPQAGYDDYQDFYLAVRKSMLLEQVNRTKYTDLYELLLENTAILENELTELKAETNSDVIDEAMRIIVQQADSNEFTKVETLISSIPTALSTARLNVSGNQTQENVNVNRPGATGGGGGFGTAGGFGAQIDPSLFAPDTNQEQSSTEIFSDLAGYDWAKDAIIKLYEKGVVNGVSENRFEPARSVTREEFVKLICEAFKLGKASGSIAFSDVEETVWYAPYVSRAVELGLINGVSDELFGSGERITREDMAAIIYRVLTAQGKLLSVSGKSFTDSDDISDYAAEAVNQLSGAEIVNGVGSGAFAPKASATRAEASVIILRCIEKFSF